MKARTKKFSQTELLDIFMTIACAVKHLHSQEPPIAHRDLKIENVLLHEDGTYKVVSSPSTRRVPVGWTDPSVVWCGQ